MSNDPMAEQRAKMQALAQVLDEVFNPQVKKNPGAAKDMGFALLIFPFGEIDRTKVNYIGNGRREDVLCAMKELIARWEGRLKEPTTVQ